MKNKQEFITSVGTNVIVSIMGHDQRMIHADTRRTTGRLSGGNARKKISVDLSYKVEYEIPPLRAIYSECFRSRNENLVRDYISKNKPNWKIRKITRQ